MSSNTSLHYHMVFSTKNRRRSISTHWQDRLHEYLGGCVQGLAGYPQGIGGTADHVHLLVGLKATHCLSNFVRELKKASTKWVHESVGRVRFSWQEGYAAFTVGATSRDKVKDYMARQEEHHRQRTFTDELIELLERAGVDYDSKYLQ